MIAIIACASIVMFVASLVITPWMLMRIPVDYFDQEKPHLVERLRDASAQKAVTLIVKNCAGVILFFLGVLMLVLPGQGLVTMVLSLILIDFPGKFRIERWLVSRGKILATINWVRGRAKRPPLVISRTDV